MPSIDRDELARVLGGFSLPLELTPDHRFDGEGPLLTEALRQGMNRSRRAPRATPQPRLRKSTTNPGWCDDGFGIVPCR